MLRRQHVLPLLLLAAGCATRQRSAWRLTGQVLTPPVARQNFTAQRGPARGACPRSDAVAVDARKGRLKLGVNGAVLEKQPKGWLADWAETVETERCVAPGQGGALAARVLDSVPLTSGARFRLLRADDVRAGYIDLGPGNRLEVISPILRPGADEKAPLIEEVAVAGSERTLDVTLRASPDLLGHETDWYGFGPKAGGGTRIVAISAETSIQRKVEPRDAPAKNYFAFGAEAGFYRLFYKADQTAVLAGTPTRAQLPQDVDRCSRDACVTIPKKVGVNPYVVVRVNGNEVDVPAHMPPTVRAAIAAAKARPEMVLATLRVTKAFGGRQVPIEFDRTKNDILGLVLTGDEDIGW
jgi:hypothetical protein